MYENIHFPGWEVMRKIGEGSFGGVYEIHRTLPDGRVEKAALKKLTVPKDNSEIRELYSQSFSKENITAHYKDQMQGLVNEYTLTQELNGCRNVVACHEVQCVQHADGIGWDIYIRMELLKPLKQVLSIDYHEATVLKLGLSLCSALLACQEHHIIHRDIKPENILVSDRGEFKLGDFGIAKVSEKTATGTMTGTMGYMAPEVANRWHYGAQADIYSLGMVLYWMMNRHTLPFLPFPPAIPTAAQRQDAANRRFAGEDFPPPVNGSRALKAIVMKACAFSTENRYQTVRELRRDLQAYCQQRRAGKSADTQNQTGADGLNRANESFRDAPPETGRKRKTASAKRIVPILAASLFAVILLFGWFLAQRNGSRADESLNASTTAPQIDEMQAVTTYAIETTEPTEAPTTVPTEEAFVLPSIPPESELYGSADYLKVTASDNLFSVLPGHFRYSGGAGGWATDLNLYEDGTFDGSYRDWDMGDAGQNYLKTCYTCDFSGAFSTPQKVSDYVYSVSVQRLDYPGNVGKEWIEDGVRYIQSDFSGLSRSREYYIYLPGCPSSVFTEEQQYYLPSHHQNIPQGNFCIYASDGGSPLGFWGTKGGSIFSNHYQYNYGAFRSELRPDGLFGKANLLFWPEDGGAVISLDFDWNEDSQRTFVAEDEHDSGEYDVTVYVTKDLQSAIVNIQSREGVSLKDWGGTSDGRFAATYSLMKDDTDIKPDNIMVSSDGTFKLGDFGIAKTSEKTQTGTMAGTYNYMAPEVANRKRYGLAADIYSLGMVLYWMMNNKTMPFLPLPPQIPSASQKQQALNRRFSGEQLPEPQNGSRELKEIVAKACAYAPEDRYHSALEMRNALEALSSSKQAWTKAILEELALPDDILHESNRPIAQRAAAEEKPPKSDIPPAKRKPIVPLVVCGILGICILAGGLLWLNRKHASPEPAAMTEALQEQTETAAEPEETTAPGSTTEETLPAATEAESTAAVLLSNVDCTYEIAEDGITITGISGQTPSEVILPEELENLPVTRIGNGAFQSNTSLKKVTLPSGILVIGEKAFSGCTRLQSISFPDGLTEISASAFENCSNLSSVLLPESVHAIGPWAFSNCKKLLSITIPGSASDLGEWAFSGCSSLSELTFSPGITTISNYLFYNCQGLKAVTIPDGVITIGIGAFSGCTALSEVTLPESMRTLSSEAFQGTALESISVPSACSLGSNAVPLGCKIYSTR